MTANDIEFDYAVIGLGAMGLACAASLSKTGRVIGFDQYSFDHWKGSSGCESKIFRFSCFEGLEYSKLAGRSFELWNELANQTNTNLFSKTGVLMIGDKKSAVISNTIASAAQTGKSFRELNSSDICKRFPVFNVPKSHIGILDNNSGIIFPTPAHEAFLHICEENAATTLFSTEVHKIEYINEGCLKIFTQNRCFVVSKVVLCAGPWINSVLNLFSKEQIHNLINVQRIVSMWFRPDKTNNSNDVFRNFPAFYWDLDGLNQLYGFPLIGEITGGIKIGLDNDRMSTTAVQIDRSISASEINQLQEFLGQYMPSVNGKFIKGHPCMFSMSSDTDFIVGNFKNYRNVFLAAGFSGRGYKFAPAIGEMIHDLMTKGESLYYSEKFNPRRFFRGNSNEN